MKTQTGRVFFGVLLIGILLVVAQSQALASIADSTASLDLSQFNISWGLNWTTGSQTTGTNALASNSLGENGTFSDLEPGWVSSSSAVNISNAYAQGATAASVLISSVSHSNLDGIGSANSSGSAMLTGSFTVTTAGWVFVTIPYTISLGLAASNDPAAAASGDSKAWISLSKAGAGVSTDSMEITTTVYNGNTFNQTQSAIFGVMKWFDAGETGTFTAETSTQASASEVPLPAALGLFAPGLACLFGLRKRPCKERTGV
ncbi:MAG TPA: hypothetical protein VMT62_16080 [Syntrophorhabdaceae bacterium]|nr:hypothetical protein [Syntrophorhabdaceae bacterium]